MAKNQPPFTPEQARALSKRPPESRGGQHQPGTSHGSRVGEKGATKQAFKPGLRTGVKGRN